MYMANTDSAKSIVPTLQEAALTEDERRDLEEEVMDVANRLRSKSNVPTEQEAALTEDELRELELVFDPSRVKFPRRLVGPRGSAVERMKGSSTDLNVRKASPKSVVLASSMTESPTSHGSGLNEGAAE